MPAPGQVLLGAQRRTALGTVLSRSLLIVGRELTFRGVDPESTWATGRDARRERDGEAVPRNVVLDELVVAYY